MTFNKEQFETYAKDHLAKSDFLAERRFIRFKSKDPFKDIPPALLNSSDIFKYVVATGMLYPFNPNPKNFKGASYSVKMLGEYAYWDEQGKFHTGQLEKNKGITLMPNSITFVTLEPTFRLPDYIALRFNLHITHVHKGLLLGTGPLVDPGFEGKLTIPLHNFTLNEYTLYGGQDLVWVEFTKLSPYEDWIIDEQLDEYKDLMGYYAEFPPIKKDKKIFYYIEKAVKDVKKPQNEVCVRNAIPEYLRDVREDAKFAKRRVRQFTWGAIITLLVTAVLAAWGAIWPIASLVQDSTNYVQNASQEVESKIKQYDLIINEQNKIITEQNRKLEDYSKKIEDLKKANNLK